MNDATAQAKAAAQTARRQLGDTLDQIEDKFNVPKRTGELVDKAKTAYEKNPVPWIIGAAAVGVIAVGLVAWAIFSDD
ncbi:DUF3618 domain-containing protein [Protaetiibacter mangrovi]|uniref:DUF3618 domain-containing protein n=1 Tax=Protaetiibacter mangrovi TaxID=2970926 RepID=A0ABT1ZCG3_9MICO|nr:DUF3618 domain-containing protein [Protaetiibacter mangrovi]MCS0498369.1 DUF3618 domain-containing protein [Protaetiibacter mangrovi]TPW92523.1 DUF3618 domain-containing protein [Schumannella luteola]